MTTLSIFEKITLKLPIEQRKFFNYLDDTITELSSQYGDFLFIPGENDTPPKILSDELNVLPLYEGAIVDNILFLASNEQLYKSEFLRKAKYAYNKYWSDDAKGKRIKRGRW